VICCSPAFYRQPVVLARGSVLSTKQRSLNAAHVATPDPADRSRPPSSFSFCPPRVGEARRAGCRAGLLRGQGYTLRARAPGKSCVQGRTVFSLGAKSVGERDGYRGTDGSVFLEKAMLLFSVHVCTLRDWILRVRFSRPLGPQGVSLNLSSFLWAHPA